jgi:hypothetical protein
VEEDLDAILQRLATTLRESPRFMDAWDQFHDEVSVGDAFSAAGQRGRNPRLEIALAAVGAKLFGKKQPLTSPMMLHLPDHGFWHGTCGIGEWMAIFFYFERNDTGLAGLFRHITDSQVELVRFSLVEVPAGAVPSTKRGQA